MWTAPLASWEAGQGRRRAGSDNARDFFPRGPSWESDAGSVFVHPGRRDTDAPITAALETPATGREPGREDRRGEGGGSGGGGSRFVRTERGRVGKARSGPALGLPGSHDSRGVVPATTWPTTPDDDCDADDPGSAGVGGFSLARRRVSHATLRYAPSVVITSAAAACNFRRARARELATPLGPAPLTTSLPSTRRHPGRVEKRGCSHSTRGPFFPCEREEPPARRRIRAAPWESPATAAGREKGRCGGSAPLRWQGSMPPGSQPGPRTRAGPLFSPGPSSPRILRKLLPQTRLAGCQDGSGGSLARPIFSRPGLGSARIAPGDQQRGPFGPPTSRRCSWRGGGGGGGGGSGVHTRMTFVNKLNRAPDGPRWWLLAEEPPGP